MANLPPTNPSRDYRAGRLALAGKQALGLVVLALLILLAALWRASWKEIFPAGWWRW